jgi:hypothetical protein
MANQRSRVKCLLSVAIAFSMAPLGLIGVTTAPSAFATSTRPTPACDGRDLVAPVTGSESGLGNGISTIAVTNVGASTCRLGGYPRLLGIRTGHEYKLRITGHGTQDGNLGPVVLSPRISGAFILNTTTGCVPGGDSNAASHTYSGIVVLLPGKLGLFKILGITLYAPCDLLESQLGWAKDFAFLVGS